MKNLEGYTLTEIVSIIERVQDIEEEEMIEEMYQQDLNERIRKAKTQNDLNYLADDEIRELIEDGELIEGYDTITNEHYVEWYKEYKVEKVVDEQPLPF